MVLFAFTFYSYLLNYFCVWGRPFFSIGGHFLYYYYYGFFSLMHGCLFLCLSHRTKKFWERQYLHKEKKKQIEKNAPIRRKMPPFSCYPVIKYTISDLTIQEKLSVKDTKKITGNNKKVIKLRHRCEDKASTHYLI